MIWRLYLLCSIISLAILTLFSLVILVFILPLVINKPGLISELIFATIVLLIPILKNTGGIKLYRQYTQLKKTSNSTGIFFFILWLFNLILMFALLMILIELGNNNFPSRVFQRPYLGGIILMLLYPLFLSLLYTLALDLSLQKRVKQLGVKQ